MAAPASALSSAAYPMLNEALASFGASPRRLEPVLASCASVTRGEITPPTTNTTPSAAWPRRPAVHGAMFFQILRGYNSEPTWASTSSSKMSKPGDQLEPSTTWSAAYGPEGLRPFLPPGPFGLGLHDLRCCRPRRGR